MRCEWARTLEKLGVYRGATRINFAGANDVIAIDVFMVELAACNLQAGSCLPPASKIPKDMWQDWFAYQLDEGARQIISTFRENWSRRASRSYATSCLRGEKLQTGTDQK